MNDYNRHRFTPLPPDDGLGAPLEEQLGRIIRTAVRLFNVGTVQISLMDEARWQLSSGFGRRASFSLTEELVGGLHHPAVVEVPDLLLVPALKAHPLVAGPEALRSCAAVPLFTEAGARLGTFCLLDAAPRRPMSPGEQAALLDLAGMVMSVLSHRDALAIRAAELRRRASQDLLTGLPNRRAFEDAFERAINAGEPFRLLLLDLDELKRVNDTQGHAQGDFLLARFAQALQDEFGRECEIYRWGGDEFVMLCGGGPQMLSGVRLGVDRVEQQVGDSGLLGAYASVGVADFPLDTEAPNDLLRLADQRMLREKAARRAARGLNGLHPDGQPTNWSGELLWQVLRATAALTSADQVIDQSGWQAFLEAAVAALPGAEAGSLYVLDGAMFILQAQVGFSAALLGAGRSPATMRRWHGSEGWELGTARVLRGSTALRARSYDYERWPHGAAAASMDDLCAVQLLRANLLVPVMVQGQIVAALNLDNLRFEQAFSPDEVQMAEEFARQAAAILAAHDRRAREAARTQELEVLAHANAALNTVQRPEEIERILVAETRALLRTEHVVFARSEEEQETRSLRLVSASGMYAGFSPDVVPDGQGVAWHALQLQDVIHVPRILEDERIYQGGELIDGALIVAPLTRAAGTPLGALVAARAAPSSFSALDGRLLGALASVGVTAFERLQAAEKERLRSRELQMLAELSQHAGLGHDSRAVAEQCLAACRSFLGADFAVFSCSDGTLIETQGTPGASDSGLSAEQRHTQMHQLGLACLSAADGATHRYPATAEAHADLVAAGVQALVKVPVLERGRRVGVVALLWFRPLSALPESAVLLMNRSAELIGQVLDREANIADLEGTREGALLTLGMALELRDFETAGHTQRVVSLAMSIARCLGIDAAALADLQVGAYLHDIGKLAVPDAILLKPGKLDADEWAMMQRHTTIGDELVARIPTVTAQARSVVRHHHERWDGTGYPDGLRGETIPEGARIFSVADVYDALTSERPYKAAWTPQEALAELAAQAGRQFDPEIVRAALQVLTSASALSEPGTSARTVAGLE